MSAKKSAKESENINEEKTPNKTDDLITEAHRLAERDIETDPDLTSEPEPGDDLDEGELARLEGED